MDIFAHIALKLLSCFQALAQPFAGLAVGGAAGGQVSYAWFGEMVGEQIDSRFFHVCWSAWQVIPVWPWPGFAVRHLT